MSSRSANKPVTVSGPEGAQSQAKGVDANSEIGACGGVPVVVTTDVPKATLPGWTCKICRGPDTNDMVQCDRCPDWYHFTCVRVTNEVEKRSWSCPKCAAATGVQQTISTADQQIPTLSGANIRGKQQRSNDQGVLPLQKDQPVQPITSRVTRNSKRKETLSSAIPQEPLPVPENRMEIPPLALPHQSDAPVVPHQQPIETNNKSLEKAHSTRSSNCSRRSLLKLQLQKLEEENALQREFIQKKYSILEQINEQGGSSYDGDSRINEWVKQNNTLLGEGGLNEVLPNAIQNVVEEDQPISSGHQGASSQQSLRALPRWTPSNISRITEPPADRFSPIPRPQSTPHPTAMHNTVLPTVVPRQYHTLNSQQLAARQAISKDLPTFSGHPEEWPVFLSTFNSTTTMCGFTDEENIIRLQRCLKGKAYEAVKCLLMHPSNVRGVMDTLRMLFGQPELIVHSLISKINSLPAMREDKFETIVDFAVNVRNFCATVDACGLEEYLYNISLLHQLVAKLPPTIKLDWARYRQTIPNVNLASFGNWVYLLAEAASTIAILPQEAKSVRNDSRGTKKGNAFLNAHSETSGDTPSSAPTKPSTEKKQASNDSCPICRGGCRAVEKCKRFLELSRDSRWAAVREHGLCRRCLRHHNGACKAKLCGKEGCALKHHELLHNEQKVVPPATSVPPQPTAPQPSQEGTSKRSHDCNVHRTSSSTVLFRYLPVVLHGKNRTVQTYAFFDEGSELTLIDQELANELQLGGVVQPLCLRWTGGTQRNEKSSRIVSLDIAGVQHPDNKFPLMSVRTVKELLLPLQTLDVAELEGIYPHLRGLPIDSYRDARPRILIGMKHASIGMVLKCREGNLEDPIAVKTRIGWTICGGLSRNDAAASAQCMVHMIAEDQDPNEMLHQAMKSYFALDSLGVAKPDKILLSSEDQRAQQLLQSLTTFDGSRYKVGLLWRHDNIRLPDNRTMALRRHHHLQKRMEKDPELAETLNSKIADYVAKGYARKLTPEEINQNYSRIWYLPVFPVTNPNKPGKVRLVWDAAAKTFGVSLNSALLKGPDLLCSLFVILLQFRQGRIGLTGDIREMFHQVAMWDEDQQCQRFFWLDENGELSVYVLQVMSFGACCSPSCAQYIKNLNAERFTATHPSAVEAITKRHYVDDMLVSVDEESEAVRLAEEVKYVHSQGGFEIRNWISNSKRVLTALQERTTEEKDLDLSPEVAMEKVLGMWWRTETDEFMFKVGWTRYDPLLLTGQRPPTKREMLRVLMTIFDPLGLVAHFLVFLKILLQEVWRANVQWDEEIKGDLYKKWQQWTKILPQVETVRVPRCYSWSNSLNSCTDIQLHTFVDASEKGFAAVAFLRFDFNGSTMCSIVTSKTRVAPLKFLSIPRLELQAAVVGARLAQTIITSLSLRITRRIYWTDSRDVLHWINSDHRRYSQFVAFRVSELLETSEPEEWRWVPTRLNVADDGTKWDGTPDLTPESRWFRGPDFLWLPESKWPQTPPLRTPTTTELRPHLLVHRTAPTPSVTHFTPICVSNFSNWRCLRNSVALIFRYVSNLRLKVKQQPILLGPLSSVELTKAEEYLFRYAQHEGFPDDIAALKKTCSAGSVKSLLKTSPLYQLDPQLDERGVLRMRTRIGACQFATDDAKKPIIMPRDHHITNLIIKHYHQRYHHRNHETVINELRQRFHIPRIRVGYAKARKSCQRCKNETSIPRPPVMADLPPARLAAFTRPFTYVGIDYFGPMEVVLGRRVEKRWGMLITCLTVRAIHIELVCSLSTDSCIMGLRNFISRRGTPRRIYSDRGTNFVGASRELKETMAAINEEEFMEEFVSPETEWVFNPPAAPHMGGCWERLIRTVKTNLMAIRSARKPTDEVLRNVLTEVEGIVNSRPLTHVPIDSDSAPALTPNHFLLGSSDGTKPLTTLDDSGAALQQNWRTSQVLANQFWRRWVTDYLPEITRRTRWFAHTKPMAVGDIVVIVDSKLPRSCWPKGRIIHTRVGSDGCIRSATVQTANGIYERPVTKLAVLDVRREEQ